jgi:hypothetical protein
MSEKCNHILLVFENCDALEIPVKDVLFCHIQEVHRNLDITNSKEYFSCNQIHLVLDAEILKKETAFDFEVTEHFTKFHDITSVNIVYEDGTQEGFYAPWNYAESNEMTNSFETTLFTGNQIIIDIERK